MVVVPTGNWLPAGTPLRVRVALPQLSFAVAVPKVASLMTTAHEVAPAVDRLTAGGAVMLGAAK